MLSAAQISQLYQYDLVPVSGGLPLTTPVTVAAGATFDLNGRNQMIDSLSGAGTVTTTAASAIGASEVDVILAPAGTATFSGVIQDGAAPMGVTMNGPGTQVFASTNSYTGVTTVNGGVLDIAAPGSLFSGGIVVSAGTLEVGCPGAIDNASSITGAGTILLPTRGRDERRKLRRDSEPGRRHA